MIIKPEDTQPGTKVFVDGRELVNVFSVDTLTGKVGHGGEKIELDEDGCVRTWVTKAESELTVVFPVPVGG